MKTLLSICIIAIALCTVSSFDALAQAQPVLSSSQSTTVTCEITGGRVKYVMTEDNCSCIGCDMYVYQDSQQIAYQGASCSTCTESVLNTFKSQYLKGSNCHDVGNIYTDIPGY